MTAAVTTAQLLAAGGSIGGAIATTVAVVLAYRGLRGEVRRGNEQRARDLEQRALDAQQRAQDRQDRRHREAAQARLVLVNVNCTLPPPAEWAMELATDLRGEVQVRVENHSSEPIFSAWIVNVALRVRSGRLPFPHIADLEPGNRWALDPAQAREDDNGPLLAGASRSFDVVVSRHTEGGGWVRHVVAEGDQYVVTVAYTDAAGLRWLRTGDELPRPDPTSQLPRAT